MKEISVIVPAFNEEESIGAVLDGLKTLLQAGGFQYELTVVDDASTDRTKEIACSTGARVIGHTARRGYGASLKSGIKAAHHDLIAMIDADGTYPVESLVAIASEMEDSAMVVGARTGEKVSISFLRGFAKWFLTRLANYLSGTKIPDLNSGLRVFRKGEAMRYFGILPDGFSFTTTLTLAMAVKGSLIKYIPINYYKRRGRSKIRPMQDAFNFTTLIIRTILYFNPLKVFIPLSLFFVMLAFGVLAFGYFVLGLILDSTFAILMLASLQVFVVGMLADLIDKRLLMGD